MMASKKGSSKERFNMRENTRAADIVSASQSLIAGKSYENGWPAEKGLHINQGRSKK